MYLSYEVNEKGFFSIVSSQLISFYPKFSSTLQGINYLIKKHQDTHLCSLSLCLSTSHSHLGFFLSSSSSAYLPSPFSLFIFIPSPDGDRSYGRKFAFLCIFCVVYLRPIKFRIHISNLTTSF